MELKCMCVCVCVFKTFDYETGKVCKSVSATQGQEIVLVCKKPQEHHKLFDEQTGATKSELICDNTRTHTRVHTHIKRSYLFQKRPR